MRSYKNKKRGCAFKTIITLLFLTLTIHIFLHIATFGTGISGVGEKEYQD